MRERASRIRNSTAIGERELTAAQRRWSLLLFRFFYIIILWQGRQIIFPGRGMLPSQQQQQQGKGTTRKGRKRVTHTGIKRCNGAMKKIYLILLVLGEYWIVFIFVVRHDRWRHARRSLLNYI